MSSYDKEEMLESLIIEEIVKNKDKIKFIERIKSCVFNTYLYEFRLYLNEKNIFGFRKYLIIMLTIISNEYFITITVADKKIKVSNSNSRYKLKKILENCYEDKSRYIILKNLCEIIKK